MEQKYYLILGIIIILVISGIFFTFLFFQKMTGNLDSVIGLVPYVDVEATVTSLFLDDLYSDCQEPEVCLSDRVTLKIDSINLTGDPSNVMNLNVGDEIEFNLKFSARPAKLRRDLPPSCRSGKIFKAGSCIVEGCGGFDCSASSPQYIEKPAEMEGNYIIYHLPQLTDEITENTLPGLEEDSRVKIRILTLGINEIQEYELIL